MPGKVIELARIIVVYESKYGNTRRAAEAIGEGARETPGVEAVVKELKEVGPNQLVEYDAIMVGSPNHIGSATRGIKKFIDRLGKLDLEGKAAAAFDLYLQEGKAVRKMEKQLGEKAPGLKLVAPGLSVRVEGMKGPIADGELPRCREFGARVATGLKGKTGTR